MSALSQTTVPYRLDADPAHQYYPAVRSFCKTVSAQILQHVAGILSAYEKWYTHHGHPHREPLELQLEILALGVFWHIYGGTMLQMTSLERSLLATISVLRRSVHHQVWIDKVKGVLLAHTLAHQTQTRIMDVYTPADLKVLLNSLEAVGDFEYEVVRWRYWCEFLDTQSLQEWQYTRKALNHLVSWFAEASVEELGDYTHDVEVYRQKVERRGREDFLLCQKPRLEYHLNMLGAELLNQAFRSEFTACRRYEVLVPGCMCAQTERTCRAKPGILGKVCVGCTPTCRVNQITEWGRRSGYAVSLVGHESEILAGGTADTLLRDSVGVVGVACVPNLIHGGWKLRSYGIAAQCVLLECSGCCHWLDHVVPTTLNMQELDRVMMWK